MIHEPLSVRRSFPEGIAWREALFRQKHMKDPKGRKRFKVTHKQLNFINIFHLLLTETLW